MQIISASINVELIDKTKLIKGKKGTYYNFDIIINDGPNEYGNDTSICIEQSKEERTSKQKRVYLGSGKTVFKTSPAIAPEDTYIQSSKKDQGDDDYNKLPF